MPINQQVLPTTSPGAINSSPTALVSAGVTATKEQLTFREALTLNTKIHQPTLNGLLKAVTNNEGAKRALYGYLQGSREEFMWLNAIDMLSIECPRPILNTKETENLYSQFSIMSLAERMDHVVIIVLQNLRETYPEIEVPSYGQRKI